MNNLQKLLIAASITLFTAGIVHGQVFRAPEKYTFDTPDSYHKYDKDVLKCAKWLDRTPPGSDDEGVKRAGRFLLEWLSGAPYMRFRTNVRVDAYLGDSPQYRIYYMAGWARCALESNGAVPDKKLCTYAGLKSVIKVYKAANSAKKDPNIEELVELEAKSKLKEWVDSRS